jgi:septal ring factor EnvC (AmiA/AmiB activator)
MEYILTPINGRLEEVITKADHLATLEAAVREKDETLRQSWDHKDDYGKQIATLTADVKGLQESISEYYAKELDKTRAENTRLRKALEPLIQCKNETNCIKCKLNLNCRLEDSPLTRAQAAIKQTEPSAFWQDKNGAFHPKQTEGGGR